MCVDGGDRVKVEASATRAKKHWPLRKVHARLQMLAVRSKICAIDSA